MKTGSKLWLILVLLIQSTLVLGQEERWCGTYDKIEYLKKTDPDYLLNQQKLEKFTKEFLEKYPNAKEGELYVVPIVFHIIHDYGPENISYETVMDVVDNLNDIYRNRKNIHASVVSEFIDLIPDTEIEFRLAKIDPDGNCTLGITRTHSLVTYTADWELYSVAPAWDNTKYLNVWLVNTIPGGVAGWSTGVGGSPSTDGLVFEYSAINGYTFAHEVAHSLNIAHTWGPTNDPDISTNCNMDDGIEDTPNTIGSAVGACNKDQVTCGSLDNVQNIMDYSGCKLMFTEGQAAKMRATLNSATGGRNNLWKEENLIATGTNDGFEIGPCAPIADFGWDENYGCQGLTVQFKDASYNADVTSWSWEFEGGVPATSTEQNPIVTFDDPGLFNVSLSVENEIDSDEISKPEVIQVEDTIRGYSAPFVESFESEGFPLSSENPDLDWMIVNDESDGWEPFHIETNQTVRVNNRLVGNDNLSTLISPNIDISEYDGNMYFTFKMAYAPRTNDSDDELRIYVSKDCGQSWIIRYIKSANQLATNGGDLVSDTFIPQQDQWREERINLTNFDEVNHFKIKFVCESQRGNALYLDDLQLGEVESGLQSLSADNQIKVFPNPTQGDVNISYFAERLNDIQVSVSDISGKIVIQRNITVSEGENMISLSGNKPLTRGIYIIRIANASKIHSQKLILY